MPDEAFVSSLGAATRSFPRAGAAVQADREPRGNQESVISDQSSDQPKPFDYDYRFLVRSSLANHIWRPLPPTQAACLA
jgi:hypothetical protein